jgi:hypothetical protein
MNRLARRASLLVAFSLLTSTATAYAECAWVLWSQMGTASFESILAGTANLDQVATLSASKSKEACQRRLRDQLAIVKSQSKFPQAIVYYEFATVLQFDNQGKTQTGSTRYVCLRDTVVKSRPSLFPRTCV